MPNVVEILLTADNKGAISGLKDVVNGLDNFSKKALSSIDVGDLLNNSFNKTKVATNNAEAGVEDLSAGLNVWAIAGTAALAVGAMLVAKWLEQSKAVQIAEDAQEGYTKSLAKSEGAANSEIATVNSLVKAISDETISRNERQRALDNLAKKYPAYFAQQGIDIDNTNLLKEATLKLSDALLRKSKVDSITETIKRAEILKTEALNASIRQQIGNLSGLEQALVFVKSSFEGIIGSSTGAAISTGLVNEAANINKETITGLDKVLVQYKLDLDNAIKSQIEHGDNLDKTSTKTANATENTKKLKDAVVALSEAWKPTKGTFKAATPDKGINTPQDIQKRDLAKDAADQKILNQAVAEYNLLNQQATYSIGTQLTGLKDLLATQQIQAEFIASGLTPSFDAFFQTLFSGGDAVQAFIDSLKQMLSKIIATLVAALALQAVLSALFPGKAASGAFSFSKILGMIGGGGLSSFFGNKNATGGVATKATAGIFGEAGPEAIIPLNRLPEMMGSIGGGNMNQQFIIRGSDLVTVLNRSNQNLNFIG